MFQLTGMMLAGFGIWTVIEKSALSPLLSPMFIISVYGMVAIGGVVLVATTVGCVGTTRESHCSLVTVSG